MKTGFIPLCVRSHYSLMWGTAPVQRLVRRAKAKGYHCIALTDTDNLYGLWPFIDACEEQGVKPVIGAEVTDPDTGSRAVCLVKNRAGYANLTRLLTRRHRDKAFSLETCLPQFHPGLLVLAKSPDLLAAWHDHGVDLAAHLPRTAVSRQHPLCRAARRRNLPIVATPGSFFPDPPDLRIHAMLRAIDRNRGLADQPPGDVAPANAFLDTPAGYARRFATCPDTLAATATLSEKLAFTRPDFGIVMPPLEDGAGDAAGDAGARLRQATLAGAARRYGSPLPQKVAARIDHELDVIREKRFCEYFLVVQAIVRQASRICGRGSGAASIVAYCLGITNVCPIKFNLYFERFLNPGRQDPPDIDVDFAWDERDDILARVLSDFPEHAAMVSSHILFQPRMAVREVAKVFGLPDGEIGKVSKRLPWFWKLDEASEDLLERIRKRAEFRHMDFPEPWPEIMAYAQAIVGTPRYLSVHPGGVVITPDPIDTYVPVETAPKGVPLIQWEKDATETAGLVKIDLLGNRSLGVIRDAIAAIESEQGAFEDFSVLDPEDDFETQQNVAQGNTMGCFYIESPAMRLLQKKSGVGDFEHVVIHSSIIRPAANEFIQQYLERLHTGVWEPIHPLLEGVLTETFGIMVYQEDVSRVAVEMAGFSHAQADGLRKIMSKKDKTRELADYYDRFRRGAARKGVSEADIRRVWDMIISFSGYSFCKPHSASYARVSFQAAFLKTHYPAHFMAAVISNQGGFYSTFAYVSEARRLGVAVDPPDVTQSNIRWQGRGRRIRVGLMAIRELSRRTMARIIQQREEAFFKDLPDFLARTRPRENEIRALIHSGSLDVFTPGSNRAALLWDASAWQAEKKKGAGPPGLFDQPYQPEPAPDLPPENPLDRLRREFAALGFLCSRHPIVLFREAVNRERTIQAIRIPGHVGRRVTFAGWLISGKTVKTKHGEPMKFLTFEDETGILETVFFPKPYARFCHMLEYGRPYFLSGRVESDWGAVTLTVETTRPVPR